MKKTLLSLLFVASLGQASDALMERNGVSLSEAEIRAAIADLSKLQIDSFNRNPENLTKFIENLFDNKYMAKNVLENIDQNEHFEIIKDMTLNRFYINYYLKEKVKTRLAEVGDLSVAARQEYDANPDKYKADELVDFYHLLFVRYDNPEAVADGKAQAEAVLNAIKSGEMTIAEAAKKYRTAINGTNSEGIVPKANPSRLTREIRDIIRELAVGEVSEIIDDKTGYHIVSIAKRHPGGLIPYNKTLEKQIIEGLEDQYSGTVISNARASFQGPEGLTFDREKLDALFEELTGVKPKAPANDGTNANDATEAAEATEATEAAEANKSE